MRKVEIPLSSSSFFAWEHFKKSGKNILLCCSDEENAAAAYKQLLFLAGAGRHADILHLPSLDSVPYDRVSPNSAILSQRADSLTKLSASQSPKMLISSAQNLLAKIPPPSLFENRTLTISKGLSMGIEELSVFLVDNGFSRAASAIDSSEFAIRGEIIDIVTSNKQGYRINFGWEKIESIREYDIYSQISKNHLPSLTLSSASEGVLNEETIASFKRNFLQKFGVNHIRSPLYESILSGRKFQGYEHLMPLFYEEMSSIYDFLGEYSVIYDNLCVQAMLEHENTYDDFYQSRLLSNKANPDSFYFAIPPEEFILPSSEVKDILAKDGNILLEPGEGKGSREKDKKDRDHERLGSFGNLRTQAKIEEKTEFEKLFEVILEHKNKIPVILCSAPSSIERIKNIIEEYEYTAKIIEELPRAKKNFINLAIAPMAITPMASGFVSDKYLLISEKGILGDKTATKSHKSSERKLKNILTELDNISEGALVTHREHGIGRFEKIQTIYADKIAHDCLKIIYENNDILYLPVLNIDQITKYGMEGAQLDRLGGANWQKRKAKLKNRIKDIAASLIKMTAKRQLAQAEPVLFEQASYEEFCNKFPYNETEDQLSSINDIKSDLEAGRLMDRLICGDVGFGKTEVAMRAAFMGACDINEDSPQIAIVSPTTILCKQHYSNFIARFSGTKLRIAQLSRLVKPAEARKNLHDLANGKINIIIGTHALLASGIKFKNLKMLIIDEEQHFGVAQKEHLKNLKTNVHVLSLSATPIPRTLQMSMVGIKDLSLIATPPIDRLPIKTTVMPFDAVVIREALMRERFRGGLSFYVSPRIKDIEFIEEQLNKFVPELKYKVAHGQMPASRIDDIMSEFCDGKFDILLSTTIIESGIDIPIANTIIIHKADMLGMSQLYQLRGRVGRGKVRGYAYLTLDHKKQITKHSMQRLEVLQNIDSLGAGFTIAGHDMDLRGFGNLVGSEQSGHIKEVGSELYQEMLDEAIAELKQQETFEKQADFTPNINLSIAILIPADYIDDSALRLAIYRRAGDLKTYDEIESFRDEMIDRFGALPEEFGNLLRMTAMKNTCSRLKIESLDSGPNGFVLKFNKNFDVSNMVMGFVNKYPRHAKIKPEGKLVFLQSLKPEILLKEAEKLLQELGDCQQKAI